MIEARVDYRTAGEYIQAGKTGLIRERNPNAAGLIHEAITDKGYAELSSGFREYRFFTDDSDIYNILGLHLPIQREVDFFGTYQFPNKNQPVLKLVAPTGAGKTAAVNRLTGGLERYVNSQTDLYAITGCPVNESPLNLTKDLSALCPHCQGRLENELEGRWEEMPIKPLRFSAARGIGIGRLEPRQTREGIENQQVVNQIILGANKGILEIPEFCQHDPNFLRSMMDLFRGGVLQVGRERYRLDLVVLAHTTRKEFEEFSKDIKNNGPLLERLRIIHFPYIRSVSQEKSIYASDLDDLARERGLHLTPGALEFAAEIAIRTRLKTSNIVKNGAIITVSTADKILLYDGFDTPTLTQRDRKIIELEAEKAGEGFEGISPPRMSRDLGKCMTGTEKCFDPLDFSRSIISGIDETPVSEMPNRSLWKREAEEVLTKYKENLLKTVERAFEERYEVMIDELFRRYVDEAGRSVDPQRPTDIDPVTGLDRLTPDEKLLKELENLMAVDETKSRDTRLKITGDPKWRKNRDTVTVNDFPGLAEAIRKKVVGTGEKPREILRLVTPTPEQQVLIAEAQDRLIQKGFCPICSEKAIKFAQSEFRKK